MIKLNFVYLCNKINHYNIVTSFQMKDIFDIKIIQNIYYAINYIIIASFKFKISKILFIYLYANKFCLNIQDYFLTIFMSYISI